MSDLIRLELGLSGTEQARAIAHLRWCTAARVASFAAKRWLKKVPVQERRKIGTLLVRIATEQASMPFAFEALMKAWRLLGLDIAELYSAAQGMAGPATGPVIVCAARESPPGELLPPRPMTAARPPAVGSPEFTPHAESVAAIVADTDAVAAVLRPIFGSEDEVATTKAIGGGGDDITIRLDLPHTALLRQLSSRARWARGEMAAAAAAVGLLPDGAIDVLNEAALDACDDVVCHGQEEIEMNPNVLEELLR